MNGATLWKKRVFLLDDIATAMEFVMRFLALTCTRLWLLVTDK